MVKKRILIVDDEPAVTRGLKLNLESTSAYAVREEHKGARALAAAREFKPDLILLDVIMPDVDGGDVASQIRADENLKHTPIVFLTAAVSKEEVNTQGGLIGGQPFLAKPVNVKEVIQCIRRHLGT
ncbi:MAG: two-component system response regulator [Candidatus Methylomirabilales bacterium]